MCLRQHIFDRHSSIFSADVALDKHCMTSSQKSWTKLPQGHWRLIFTDSSFLCTFVFSLSSFSRTCNSLRHGTNYFIIIHFVFCLLFSTLDPEVMAALSGLHKHPSKLDSSCVSIKKCSVNHNQIFSIGNYILDFLMLSLSILISRFSFCSFLHSNIKPVQNGSIFGLCGHCQKIWCALQWQSSLMLICGFFHLRTSRRQILLIHTNTFKWLLCFFCRHTFLHTYHSLHTPT